VLPAPNSSTRNLGASEAYERFTEADIDRIFDCLGSYQE